MARNSSASLRRLRESTHYSRASKGKHKMVGFSVSTPEQIVNANRYWGRLRGLFHFCTGTQVPDEPGKRGGRVGERRLGA